LNKTVEVLLPGQLSEHVVNVPCLLHGSGKHGPPCQQSGPTLPHDHQPSPGHVHPPHDHGLTTSRCQLVQTPYILHLFFDIPPKTKVRRPRTAHRQVEYLVRGVRCWHLALIQRNRHRPPMPHRHVPWSCLSRRSGALPPRKCLRLWIAWKRAGAYPLKAGLRGWARARFHATPWCIWRT